MNTLSLEQVAIRDFVRDGAGHGIVVACAGAGKCLGRGTPVLRFDGRIVPVEAVVPGDRLMGPDSKPRRVRTITRGHGPLFEIRPTKGASWVCNDVHVLTLSGTNRHYGETIDIPLRDHIARCLARGERLDRDWKLFRVGVEFPSRPVELDPYLVGLWLGNGTLGTANITSAEDQIFTHCQQVADTLGYEAVRHRDRNTWCIRFRWPGGGGTRATPNIITHFFKRISACGEKRIPENYLVNDRTTRLALLAGIIDTDGFLDHGHGGYEVTSKYKIFADQIAYVARSLGLAAYVTRKLATIRKLNFSGEYWRVYISGDVSIVPCLLTRRVASKRQQIKRASVTGFTVKSLGDGEFFGFTLTGDGRFLLGDFTVTHNTSTVVESIKALPPTREILCCAYNARIRDRLLTLVPSHVRVRSIHQLGRDTLRAYPNFRRFVHDEDGTKARSMAVLALANSPYATAVEASAGEEKRAAVARYTEVRDAVVEGATLVKATCTTTRAELLELIQKRGLDVTDDPNEVAGFIADAVRRALLAWPSTDFDDEIWLPVHYGLALRKYDDIFVDELQDLTWAQMQLVFSALREGGRVLGVGDPAQMIYAFRGACTSVFDHFRTLGATELSLSVSYRCPRQVVEHVRPYVPHIHPHENAPEGEVLRITEAELHEHVTPGDYVLSRTNAPLASIGLRLYEADVPSRVLGGVDLGQSLIAFVRRSRKRTVSALSEWLDQYVARETARDPLTVAHLEDKVETLRTFLPGETDTVGVIQRIERFFQEQSKRHHGKQVILSTVHRLKGDEAPRVFLLEWTFFLPKGDATEERNIYYVAATRAQRTLFCVGRSRA